MGRNSKNNFKNMEMIPKNKNQVKEIVIGKEALLRQCHSCVNDITGSGAPFVGLYD